MCSGGFSNATATPKWCEPWLWCSGSAFEDALLPLEKALFAGCADGESILVDVFATTGTTIEDNRLGAEVILGRTPDGMRGDVGLEDDLFGSFSLSMIEKSQWTFLFRPRFFKKADFGCAAVFSPAPSGDCCLVAAGVVKFV